MISVGIIVAVWLWLRLALILLKETGFAKSWKAVILFRWSFLRTWVLVVGNIEITSRITSVLLLLLLEGGHNLFRQRHALLVRCLLTNLAQREWRTGFS